jgi:hypothetical protein
MRCNPKSLILSEATSRFQFSLTISPPGSAKVASIHVKHASIGDRDVSEFIGRKWDFMASSRTLSTQPLAAQYIVRYESPNHFRFNPERTPSVCPCLTQILHLQNWLEEKSSLDVENQEFKPPTAMQTVGLPDDVVDLIIKRLNILDLARLCVASKPWQGLIDQERIWHAMWFSPECRPTLNAASLAVCPSFKARLSLWARARNNMASGRATLTPLVKNVVFPISKSWDRVDIDPAVAQNGSDFITYVATQTTSNYSFDVTKVLRYDSIDISKWPASERKMLQRDNPPMVHAVGNRFLMDLKNKRTSDLRDIFTKNPEEKAYPASTAISGIPNRGKFHSLVNTEADYPWILIIRTEMGMSTRPVKRPPDFTRLTNRCAVLEADVSLYDAESNRWIFQSQPFTQEYSRFSGQEHFFRFSGRHVIFFKTNRVSPSVFRVELEAKTLVHILDVPTLTIPGSDLPPEVVQRASLCIDRLFIHQSTLKSHTYLCWCDLNRLNPSSDPAALVEELVQNHVRLPVSADASSRVESSHSNAIFMADSMLTMIDLRNRRIISIIGVESNLRYSVYGVKILDDSMLLFASWTELWISDFLGRQFSEPILLPDIVAQYAAIQGDECNILHFPRAGILEELERILGSNWKYQTSAHLIPPEEESDSLIPYYVVIKNKPPGKPQDDSVMKLLESYNEAQSKGRDLLLYRVPESKVKEAVESSKKLSKNLVKANQLYSTWQPTLGVPQYVVFALRFLTTSSGERRMMNLNITKESAMKAIRRMSSPKTE